MNVPTAISPAGASKPDPTTLVIRRNFRAPVERVFRALTDPEAIVRWFGPGPVTCTGASNDLRVGGAWSVEMRSPDGEEHRISGEYLEIDAPRRVVFTWAWRSTPERVSHVTYALSPDGEEATTLTLTHERFFDTAVRDRHAQGWSGCLDKLAAWLAGPEMEERH
jgi:uncharacterized protein YndB with AHSA1/START domain